MVEILGIDPRERNLFWVMLSQLPGHYIVDSVSQNSDSLILDDLLNCDVAVGKKIWVQVFDTPEAFLTPI